MSSPTVRPGKRQGYPERRSARLRFDGYFAVVVSDEASYDVETQAGAKPYGLRREERFKDALADLCRNAGSIVYDAQYRMLTLAAPQHFDAAAVGSGIKRVVDQIRPNLVEFAGEASDARQPRLHVDHHDNGFCPRLRFLDWGL